MNSKYNMGANDFVFNMRGFKAYRNAYLYWNSRWNWFVLSDTSLKYSDELDLIVYKINNKIQ